LLSASPYPSIHIFVPNIHKESNGYLTKGITSGTIKIGRTETRPAGAVNPGKTKLIIRRNIK